MLGKDRFLSELFGFLSLTFVIKKKTLTSNVIPISPENSFSDSGLAQEGAMGYIEITPWKISAYDFYSRVQ